MATIPARTTEPTPNTPRQAQSVVLIPDMFCSECGNKYRPDIEKMNSGKITGVRAYCDTCFHGKQVSIHYANATNINWQPPEIPCRQCQVAGIKNIIQFDRNKGFQCPKGHEMEAAEALAIVAGVQVGQRGPLPLPTTKAGA